MDKALPDAPPLAFPEFSRAKKEMRVDDINAELLGIKEKMQILNARYGELSDERWGLQCDLARIAVKNEVEITP